MSRTKIREIRIMVYYVGLVILSLSGLMLVSLVTALVQKEWAVAVDFVIGCGLAGTVGFGLMLLRPAGDENLSWRNGLAASAAAWLVAMIVAAVPYYLSGHWGSFLDAAFDVMSGLTTTGVIMVQDLDHLSDGVNMWRHLISWLGGQGMVVLALTFLVRGLPGAFRLYAGEAKDERLMPNVVHTARTIWYISVAYLVVGTLAFWVSGLMIGQTSGRAFLHGLWVFMAGWSTGGFAPMSQNILFYHSLLYEIVAIVFFVIGSFNFNLHWAVWTGDRKEIFRNLEIVTFLVTSTLLTYAACWELARLDVYPTVATLFRKGYFSIMSAHTTTGFMPVYGRQFALEWGPVAMLAMSLAMLPGGGASSTAGGFKAVRIGLAFKAIVHDVRKLLSPESSVVVEKFHMTKEAVLDDRLARTALTIIILYVTLWAALVMVLGLFAPQFGWDMPSIMFEAASITGNVGLTAGITSPYMPGILKLIFILAMWLGRMEFLSAFVLVAYLLKGWRSR